MKDYNPRPEVIAWIESFAKRVSDEYRGRREPSVCLGTRPYTIGQIAWEIKRGITEFGRRQYMIFEKLYEISQKRNAEKQELSDKLT